MKQWIPLFYLIPAVVIGALWFLSRSEELPKSGGDAARGIRGEFAKIGARLCRRLPALGKGGRGNSLSSDLSVLEPRVNAAEAKRLYCADRIGLTLLIVFAGSVLACLVSFSARQERVVDEDGRIARRGYGEGARQETLVLHPADDETFEREISVTVTDRRYTKEEADALFAEASRALPAAILNGNASLDEVRGDLALMDGLAGYPFAIAWKTGNYALIHSDGRVQKESVPEAGETVVLTAQYSYLNYGWEQEIPVCLYPPLYSEEERWTRGMEEILREADQETVHEDYMALPQRIGESVYIWAGKAEDNAAPLLLLAILAAGAVFVMKDRDLGKRIRDREEELIDDYPQFVSKLTLYLGAGMTVRNIFGRLAVDYAERRKRGEPARFLYEELWRAVNEMESGVSEATAYEHFAFRCRSQQYIRLCTLLTQNLRKGNGELLRLLREESKKALNERMDRARKRGEEAGTKLLLPMMLMLTVVMVIIMVPAYLSF